MQTRTASHSHYGDSDFSIRPEYDNETLRPDLLNDSSDDAQPIPEESIFGFSFEKDLQATRVYGRVAHSHSYLSLPSSAGQSRGWSFLSDLSLSKVSNVSVVSLPVSAAELYDGDQYSLESDLPPAKAGKSRSLQHPGAIHVCTMSTVWIVDAAEAGTIWPPEKVAQWMRNTYLDQSLVSAFMTDDMSGYAILFLEYKHMANYVPDVRQQRRLWGEVHRLQSVIFDELLGRELSSSLYKPLATEYEYLQNGDSPNALATAGPSITHELSTGKPENSTQPTNIPDGSLDDPSASTLPPEDQPTDDDMVPLEVSQETTPSGNWLESDGNEGSWDLVESLDERSCSTMTNSPDPTDLDSRRMTSPSLDAFLVDTTCSEVLDSVNPEQIGVALTTDSRSQTPLARQSVSPVATCFSTGSHTSIEDELSEHYDYYAGGDSEPNDVAKKDNHEIDENDGLGLYYHELPGLSSAAMNDDDMRKHKPLPLAHAKSQPMQV